MTAAPVLADARAADEAEALAIAVVRERPGSEYVYFGYLYHLFYCLAWTGQLAQATRIADEMAASAASLPSFLAATAPASAGAAPAPAGSGGAQALLAHADFAKFGA